MNNIINKAKNWCKEHYCYYTISNMENSDQIFYEIGLGLNVWTNSTFCIINKNKK